MIALKDIQSTAKGLIVANTATDPIPACLSGVEVLEDNGKITSLEEKALAENGECILIGPPLGGTTTDQTRGKAVIDVSFAVIIQQNPENGTKNIYEIVSEVVKRVLGYRSTNPSDVFQLSDKAFIIDDGDHGLWSYVLFFTKPCVI